jgi:argininosuccinate synthase
MEVAYLKKLGLETEVDSGSEFSIDQNLWGRAIECGPLEYLEKEPPEEEVFKWTKPIEATPDKPDYINVKFVNGVPVAFNDSDMETVALIEELNSLAGEHGIGRIDHVEDRMVGIKSREVYECPVATLILAAHKDLEKTVLTRHEVFFKQMIDAKWAELIYTGLWADPLREDLDSFISETQKRVMGEVRLKLFKGSVQVVGRSSPYSIYNRNLATYNVDTTFDQKAAVGFIKLWGLPTVTARSLIKKSTRNVSTPEGKSS